MALNTDRHADAVARVDHAGPFTGSHQDVGGLGGQAAQVQTRRLVRTMLTPHHAVERQLERIGFSTEDPTDVVEFRISQAEGAVKGLGGVAHPSQVTGRVEAHPTS